MTKREQAKENFKQGYNCCQAVVLAYIDELKLDKETALKLSSAFGGGMGRLREVCGAVSGMFFVLGGIDGYDDPNTGAEKMALYARVRQFANEFREANNSIICRELLQGTGSNMQGEERSAEYYVKRPCTELVGDAAEILQKYFEGK